MVLPVFEGSYRFGMTKKESMKLYQVLDKVEELHEPLKDLMKTYDIKGLETLAHKNELILKGKFNFSFKK
ncbi:hypothetical protein KHA80_19170 [Anaerobacillus sp. HL2]|nr:hypothetical protein KHA80_19170 [Anaerobacillus sp. HL2]